MSHKCRINVYLVIIMGAQEAIEQLKKAQSILAEKQMLLSEKDAQIAEKELAIAERDSLLAEYQLGLAEREAELAEYQAQLAELQALLLKKEELFKQIEASMLKKNGQLAALNAKYQTLSDQIALLQKRIFGKKSERFVAQNNDPQQLELFENKDFGEDVETRELVEQEEKKVAKKILKGKAKPIEEDGTSRVSLPDDLPREEVVIDPEGIDLAQAIKIGEEVTEQLVVTPPVIKVLRFTRNKYVLKAGIEAPKTQTSIPQGEIYIASLPDYVIPKLKCSMETIVWLLVNKYVDHLPTFRNQKILARSGIHIEYNTLSNWVQQGANRLNILLEKLKEVVLSSRYLMADETPCKVIDQTKVQNVTQGYYWVYRAYDFGLVLYDYQPGRSGETVVLLLSGYRGYLQCDGYDGYNQLFRENPGIKRLGCLAHARRKFDEAKISNPHLAQEALTLIQQLYAVERAISEQNPKLSEQQIVDYRAEHAVPLWGKFESWLKEKGAMAKPQSPIYKAINYSLKELQNLKTYLEAGYLRIDNNWVENSIRPSALGRKNYLYAGSPKTAQNSALMYSLVESCRINGINPYEYLLDVLKRLPSTNIQQLEELLPHKWKPKAKETTNINKS